MQLHQIGYIISKQKETNEEKKTIKFVYTVKAVRWIKTYFRLTDWTLMTVFYMNIKYGQKDFILTSRTREYILCMNLFCRLYSNIGSDRCLQTHKYVLYTYSCDLMIIRQIDVFYDTQWFISMQSPINRKCSDTITCITNARLHRYKKSLNHSKDSDYVVHYDPDRN